MTSIMKVVPLTGANHWEEEDKRKTTLPLRANDKNRKLALPTMEGFCFEKLNSIIGLEAQGNYTLLHFKDNKHLLVSKTLQDIETMIDDDRFVRIHRSTTINLDALVRYVKGKGGSVVLENGKSFDVSPGRKQHFFDCIKHYFGSESE